MIELDITKHVDIYRHTDLLFNVANTVAIVNGAGGSVLEPNVAAERLLAFSRGL